MFNFKFLPKSIITTICIVLCLIQVSEVFGKITYTLHLDGVNSTYASQIKTAMSEAVNLYNQYGNFNKNINVYYNKDVPTAQANYDGVITFGGSRSTRVALHEILHTIGVGTTQAYRNLMTNGTWDGSATNALLSQFDGAGSVLKGDNQHFWPYGLNYDSEDGSTNRIRCIKLAEAMRHDMGIQTAFFKIKNRGTGMHLDGYGRTTNGSNVAQYGSTTHVNAQWALESAGSYFKLKNLGTGLYLDGMGRKANGSVCGQYSGSSSYNQQWQRISINGYYQFKNRGTGLFLDGYGRTANGSDAAQHANTTHVNSQWSLVAGNGGGASMVKSNPEATTILNSGTSLELYQNYPNPANGNTVIAFNLAQKSNVVIHVYNLAGSLVQISGNQLFNTGYSEVQLNVSNLQAGIYIYMISTNHGTEKRRMVVQ